MWVALSVQMMMRTPRHHLSHLLVSHAAISLLCHVVEVGPRQFCFVVTFLGPDNSHFILLNVAVVLPHAPGEQNVKATYFMNCFCPKRQQEICLRSCSGQRVSAAEMGLRNHQRILKMPVLRSHLSALRCPLLTEHGVPLGFLSTPASP